MHSKLLEEEEEEEEEREKAEQQEEVLFKLAGAQGWKQAGILDHQLRPQ